MGDNCSGSCDSCGSGKTTVIKREEPYEECQPVKRVSWKDIPFGLEAKVEEDKGDCKFCVGDRVYVPATGETGEVVCKKRYYCGIQIDGRDPELITWFYDRFLISEEESFKCKEEESFNSEE